MAGSTDVHDELKALRAELRKAPESEAHVRPSHADEPRAVAGEDPVVTAALEEQLRELGKILSEYSDSTEEIVSKQPFVAVGAAFVLGVAIGRLLVGSPRL